MLLCPSPEDSGTQLKTQLTLDGNSQKMSGNNITSDGNKMNVLACSAALTEHHRLSGLEFLTVLEAGKSKIRVSGESPLPGLQMAIRGTQTYIL